MFILEELNVSYSLNILHVQTLEARVYNAL